MRQVSSLLSYWLYFPLAVAELSQPLAWWFGSSATHRHEPRNGAARTPKFRIARGRNRVVGWVNRIIAGIRETAKPFAKVRLAGERD